MKNDLLIYQEVNEMEKVKIDVQQVFNHHASQYDEQRQKLIPCFDDFYSIPISLLESKIEAPTVLDIGAGTGILSSFVKEKFPKAKISLIDLSENMIDIARERFKMDDQIEYIIADYTKYEFTHKFDFVISSLSIHHLTDEEKRKLYQKVYSILNRDGIFINADQVLGSTPFLDSLYKNDWKNKINSSGLTKEELQAAYERTKLDKMATLENQLLWLKEAGFTDVDVIYKSYSFVVLYGKGR
ncbi:class I SAM-dependent methyltransferase [Bacillus massilinigeriensis]|uniref:class I SAM-dependent methyltransferase n=1 Tax=Bacillus massilionigeriensis TaxID=1805475 RepID=UPI000AE31597|nr:class I SAM-dependent methyltransferase [Bacillus massilionigeriensis]